MHPRPALLLLLVLTAPAAEPSVDDQRAQAILGLQSDLQGKERPDEVLVAVRAWIGRTPDPEAQALVIATLFAREDNWKRRWSEDTKQLSDALKVADARFAEESFRRVAAEAELARLRGDPPVTAPTGP